MNVTIQLVEQTAKDSLEAFKSAIRYVDRSIGAVEDKRVRNMIGVGK